MLDKDVLSILACPVDHSPLSPADAETLERVNRAIKAGQVSNQGGRQVDQPLEAALVRADGTLLYPIRDGIPVLLPDEAIRL